MTIIRVIAFAPRLVKCRVRVTLDDSHGVVDVSGLVSILDPEAEGSKCLMKTPTLQMMRINPILKSHKQL